MQTVILSVWIIQGFLMFIDEFKFHHKRGLGKWERIGHPIDTFLFLIPFVFTQYFSGDVIFAVLCIVSSLVVTKDEFVHAKECDGAESLLHALLFTIHPVALMALWMAWKNNLEFIIHLQILLIIAFMSYQIIYWNFYKGNLNEAES